MHPAHCAIALAKPGHQALAGAVSCVFSGAAGAEHSTSGQPWAGLFTACGESDGCFAKASPALREGNGRGAD